MYLQKWTAGGGNIFLPAVQARGRCGIILVDRYLFNLYPDFYTSVIEQIFLHGGAAWWPTCKIGQWHYLETSGSAYLSILVYFLILSYEIAWKEMEVMKVLVLMITSKDLRYKNKQTKKNSRSDSWSMLWIKTKVRKLYEMLKFYIEIVLENIYLIGNFFIYLVLCVCMEAPPLKIESF